MRTHCSRAIKMNFFLCFTLLFCISILSWNHVSAQLGDFAVLQGNTIELHNSHRLTGKLKLSTSGATIVDHTKANSGYQVVLNLSDKTKIVIDRMSYMSLKDFAWYRISWSGLSVAGLERGFCFHYGFNNASWYSTYENNKKWPMSSGQNIAKGKSFSTGDDFGSIVEYLFLNTDGFAILLNDWNQWFLRDDSNQADPQLCVGANRPPGTPGHPIFRSNFSTYSMTINILTAKDIKSVHQAVFTKPGWLPTTKFQGPGKTIPDESMFKDPIWSTRVQYKKAVDQTKVLAFANEIKKHNLSVAGQIEIDNQWEKQYGDFTFDAAKFTDSKKMVDDLHKLGFKVSLWVHPFVSSASSVYSSNVKYFIKTKTDKTKAASLKFEDGVGGLIDFSNSSNADWFVGRLKKLQTDLKVDSFKFDGGEQSLYGTEVQYATPYVDQEKANLMTNRYAYTAHRLGHSVDVRSAFRNQDLPIFFRMSPKESNWSQENGLRSLIRTALTMAIGGYSFILPDMIGGNALSNEPMTDELYIRWVQASALLPAMHFSIPPWNTNTFATSTLALTKKFIALHQEHAPTIIALAQKVANGEPLIRPMWYAAPDDIRAYAVDDQFLLGDEILVAPVLIQGQTERSVFLPTGSWVDQHGKTLLGPGIVKVAAPLEELPYFKRKH